MINIKCKMGYNFPSWSYEILPYIWRSNTGAKIEMQGYHYISLESLLNELHYGTKFVIIGITQKGL